MKAPPSPRRVGDRGRMAWHSPTEVIGYFSHCADYEDAQAQRRAMPADFALADVEHPWLTKNRGWFGR
jgi:hypothetical protein